MEKEFIPYTEALALKELGFNELCFGHYQQEWDDDEINELEPSLHMIFSKQHQHAFQVCTAPTFSQCFRWFREKHGLYSVIDGLEDRQYYKITQLNSYSKEYDTYEEAELECLKKLIEIVKEKNGKN